MRANGAVRHGLPGRGPAAPVLRLRRDLRAGLIQGAYVAAGVAIGALLPAIRGGPALDRSVVSPLLLGISGGFISFIALVFSLLFLVVQYGNTTLSPRLTLFREDPMVWHTFGFFAAVFVYTATAGLRLGAHEASVSIAVPGLAILLVLVALALSRSLQLRALRVLQFHTTMEEIRRRGDEVCRTVFPTPLAERSRTDLTLPPVTTTLVWKHSTVVLRQIDLPRLRAEAVRLDAVVELRVMVGQELRRGRPYADLHASRAVESETVASALSTGPDRTFQQDPGLALRLLSDIGCRALSQAVNDPATAIHALGCTYDLLALLVDRSLEVGPFADDEGHLRVIVRFPTWEEALEVGVDEIAHFAREIPWVHARVLALLDDLLVIAPPERRPPIERRRAARPGATGVRSPGPPAAHHGGS